MSLGDDQFDVEFARALTALDEDVAVAADAVDASEGDEDDEDDVAFDVAFDRAMVVGEQVELQAEPAFAAALAERVAVQHAPLDAGRPATRRREFEFPFGPVWAPAGATTTITIRPQCVFRCEKMMATDTGDTPGMGTSIVQVAVGQKIQRPGNASAGTLTKFFDTTSRANGINFDTAHAWESIAIRVSFTQACTFYANLYGTADLDVGDAQR